MFYKIATVQRVAMRSYSFKDGLKVPAGTVLSFPNLRYNTDPDNWAADATTFNGKRWLHRRAGFDASKYQFASTAENAFDWGAGLHACPGRFMADITIKLILISLVTNYDMKLPEGSPERPVESRRFTDMTPDTSTPVLIRSVKR
jgi:cytochrome P450